jgi:Tfp pilus assembly protein PilF
MASRRVYVIACCLLLIAITAALYSRVLKNPFVRYDDQLYVTENPHIQQGLNRKSFSWAWTATYASNWHPLTWNSHELDWQLYGSNAAGHHATSLLIHLLNVVLLFFLLLKATGKLGRSFVVAVVFALHPFNVESVAWVAERKNVLCTLFFLLAIAAYGWYALKPEIKRYLAVVIMFMLALAAKPMAITLPFVLLLLDFWPLERIKIRKPAPAIEKPKGRAMPANGAHPFFAAQPASIMRVIVEKIPLLALCIGSAVLTIIAQRAAGSIQSFAQLSFSARLANATVAYARYLWKLFWPFHMAVFYPHHTPSTARLLMVIAILLAVSLLAWQQRFKRRYLLTGWLWYLGTLVPVIGIIQAGDQAMADRFAYIPMMGILVMVVWPISELADNHAVRIPLRAAATAILIAGLSFLTWRQIGYWHSTYDLWSHALDATRDNMLAEVNTATALREMNRSQEAVPHLQRATELNPQDPMLHAKLAATLAQVGEFPQAVAEYENVIRDSQDPKVIAPAYASLGALYGDLGDFVKVRDSYRHAVQASPGIAPYVIQHLSQVLEHNPTGRGYLSFGLLLQAAGKENEAQAAYQQALKLDPTLESTEASLYVLRH